MTHTSHRAEDKPAALLHVLQDVLPRQQPTLVFVSTRHHVEFLHALLTAEGLETTCVYGSMDQVCGCVGVWGGLFVHM